MPSGRSGPATRACIRGAFLNGRINVRELKDKNFAEKLIADGKEIDVKASEFEDILIERANESINGRA